jgi:phosphoribosylformimino-5-aminoimidazole carboxamide ribotide isomerase
MQIIPAIDIRGGRCVRLAQGDYNREIVFGDDPSAMAARWQDGGASRIHVVDLDGAREGRPVNAEVIQAICATATVPVQVGGGIRDIATIDQYLNCGAERVVLGTAAVNDQTTLLNAITLFRDRIIVGIDARNGMVATEGWLETSSLAATVLVHQLAEIGVSRIICTDISRDGMPAGPNFDAISILVDQASHLPSPIAVIASGGVSSLEHVQRLSALGVEGAIIGTALYTGAIDLKEALASLR